MEKKFVAELENDSHRKHLKVIKESSKKQNWLKEINEHDRLKKRSSKFQKYSPSPVGSSFHDEF
jgi:hypothetical protein